MSDRFHPLSMEQLTSWVFTELAANDSLFNVPRSAFFVPRPDHRFRTPVYGVELETPFGVAAGPHTQMAQNIIASWLVGARLIELKTIQTLDELDVNKPCIDVQDEGYNVEWSQELKVHESFDEYLRAWVLIHALHRALGFPGERPGMVFNMSVGYNLEGMLRPNVQWYFDAMADASAYLPAYVEIVARHFPAVREVEIPARLSDTITLSTMHGCPPDEIERISLYLIEERGLHTSVKCNPTLLGAEQVRGIVNDDLGFADVPIPDAAFGHDLKWADAVPMFHNLRRAAAARGVAFGLKLSNTLEVENWRTVFDRDPTMYLSGRPLHAVTTNLAARIAEEFGGELPLSFAGGADCFNVADLLGAGMRTVTVCSDLLKSGGYLRMLQYTENVDAAFDAVGAVDTADFIRRTAQANGFAGVGNDMAGALGRRLRPVQPPSVRRRGPARLALREVVVPDGPVQDPPRPGRLRLHRGTLPRRVPGRPAGAPLHGGRARRGAPRGRSHHAARQPAPVDPGPGLRPPLREHLHSHAPRPAAGDPADQALHHGAGGRGRRRSPAGAAARARVAIVGAGPAGLAAAEWLARDGLRGHDLRGAPVRRRHGRRRDPDLPPAAGADRPGPGRPRAPWRRDPLRPAGPASTSPSRRSARRGSRRSSSRSAPSGAKTLGLPGEDALGVIDGVTFLRGVQEGRPPAIGPRVGVVGAGDTAMDCVRSARRVGASSVSLIYRRTVDQMPADPEEIHAIREEGIEIVELARPVGLHVEDGQACRRGVHAD